MGLLSSTKSKLRLSRSANDLASDSEPQPENKGAIETDSPSSPSASDAFFATNQLEVHAIGYDVDQALTGRTLENISVSRVESGEAEYISVRPQKNSNSCALVRTSDPRQTPIISTIYRFGPGRHPRMRILPYDASVSVEEAIEDVNVRGELIEVKSRSMISRAQVLDTSFGKLQWRYGTGEEREGCNADSLLVMERIDRVLMPDGRKSQSGTRVAQLVRNGQFRTPGTQKYSGGNGGRLMMDLRLWDDDKSANVYDLEAFIVASCILMLKREADRFINNNVAAVV